MPDFVIEVKVVTTGAQAFIASAGQMESALKSLNKQVDAFTQSMDRYSQAASKVPRTTTSAAAAPSGGPSSLPIGANSATNPTATAATINAPVTPQMRTSSKMLEGMANSMKILTNKKNEIWAPVSKGIDAYSKSLNSAVQQMQNFQRIMRFGIGNLAITAPLLDAAQTQRLTTQMGAIPSGGPGNPYGQSSQGPLAGQFAAQNRVNQDIMNQMLQLSKGATPAFSSSAIRATLPAFMRSGGDVQTGTAYDITQRDVDRASPAGKAVLQQLLGQTGITARAGRTTAAAGVLAGATGYDPAQYVSMMTQLQEAAHTGTLGTVESGLVEQMNAKTITAHAPQGELLRQIMVSHQKELEPFLSQYGGNVDTVPALAASQVLRALGPIQPMDFLELTNKAILNSNDLLQKNDEYAKEAAGALDKFSNSFDVDVLQAWGGELLKLLHGPLDEFNRGNWGAGIARLAAAPIDPSNGLNLPERGLAAGGEILGGAWLLKLIGKVLGPLLSGGKWVATAAGFGGAAAPAVETAAATTAATATAAEVGTTAAAGAGALAIPGVGEIAIVAAAVAAVVIGTAAFTSAAQNFIKNKVAKGQLPDWMANGATPEEVAKTPIAGGFQQYYVPWADQTRTNLANSAVGQTVGGSFSDLGKAASNFVDFFASPDWYETPPTQGQGHALGGPVRAGTSYPVGEGGPEVFTPNTSGFITPATSLSKSVEELVQTFNLLRDTLRSYNRVMQANTVGSSGGAGNIGQQIVSAIRSALPSNLPGSTQSKPLSATPSSDNVNDTGFYDLTTADPVKSGVNNHADFYKSFAPYAKFAADKLGIDPSIVSAMGANESNYGNMPGNNFWGWKATDEDIKSGHSVNLATWERDKNGKAYQTRADFRTFDTPQESVQAWVDFIDKKYHGAEGAKTPEEWANALKAGGYMTATATEYAAQLRTLGAGDPNTTYTAAVKKEVPVMVTNAADVSMTPKAGGGETINAGGISITINHSGAFTQDDIDNLSKQLAPSIIDQLNSELEKANSSMPAVDTQTQ